MTGLVERLRIAASNTILQNDQRTMRDAADRITALEAQVAAADGVATMLENCLEVMKTPDQRQCCDGRECGCQGSTVYDEADFYARQELAAYRAAKGE